VREMSGAGMEFGAHTYSHLNFIYLARPGLEFEVKRAKERLEDRIGQPVHGFAYPFGKPRRHFNRVTYSMVREAGYTYVWRSSTEGYWLEIPNGRYPALASGMMT
jgi:peptidoglycan/xylan/chitin deacetylase (PgdA/CDA1 family)